MDNVTGRTDDLLIVRGINVYPSQIEAVMLDLEAVAPQYRIDLYREDNRDRLNITVERHEGVTEEHARLETDIESRLEDALGIRVDELDVVAPGVLERTEVGKVKRVYDHRED
jgi:phenylacetate-CoA ligase